MLLCLPFSLDTPPARKHSPLHLLLCQS
uniref:Uncharacterized protein n=1 Tax=Arundo donax TaxID=35708 RepID=A0A0A9F8R7_ARUDO